MATVPLTDSAETRDANRTVGGGEFVAAGLGRLAGKALWWIGVTAVAAAALVMVAIVIGPRLFPYRTYTVLSGSMQPTLPIGSQVIVRPVDAANLKVGDIIAFHKPGGRGTIVTHRIARIGHARAGTFFVTKGDANGAPDPWRIAARGSGWRYDFDVPYVGYVVEALQLLVVRLLLLATVAAALAAFALRRIWRPATQRRI